jgi:hypothetical protein
MPEAAMYKDDFSMSRQNDIWFTREVGSIKTKAISHLVQYASDEPFRLSIMTLHPGHDATSL